MSRELTPSSSLDNLKREAKRWLKALRAGDSAAHARLARAFPTSDVPAEPTLRDVQLALAREHGEPGWAELKGRVGDRASVNATRAQLADAFLQRAALDWRVGGSERRFLMNDAARILRHHPEIARENMYTAVVTGDVPEVERLLAARPQLANEAGGPRNWPPLLYLVNTRLPIAAASDNAIAIAQALLDNGADPNAFYPGGNELIHYTALTGTLGRGEEQATTHPRARELVDLLMLRGAEPYDSQVLYNVFANHASRLRLDDGIVWLLEAMFAHSARRGRVEDWHDPEWRMLNMGGYGHGAYYLLRAAIDENLLGLAEWLLAHGASANAPSPSHPRASKRTLYEEAQHREHHEMAALLARHGAPETRIDTEGIDAFVAASLSLDRATMRALIAEHPEYLQNARALIVAAERDRVDVAEALLDLGVSPDVPDIQNGNSHALHAAAYHDSPRVAQLLIDRGADVDFRESNHDAIPLGMASWANQARMVELLSRYSRDVWELTYVGAIDRLREVLRDDPQLAKLENRAHETPLMWLPSDDDAALEITRLLLSLGADAGIRNDKGLTAADIAARRGMDEVSRLLRAAA